MYYEVIKSIINQCSSEIKRISLIVVSLPVLPYLHEFAWWRDSATSANAWNSLRKLSFRNSHGSGTVPKLAAMLTAWVYNVCWIRLDHVRICDLPDSVTSTTVSCGKVQDSFAGPNVCLNHLKNTLQFICCQIFHNRSSFFSERCLLITESPRTPGHYRYLIWVLCYIPYTGLAVFSFCDFSCSCVYCDFDSLRIRVLNA